MKYTCSKLKIYFGSILKVYLKYTKSNSQPKLNPAFGCCSQQCVYLKTRVNILWTVRIAQFRDALYRLYSKKSILLYVFQMLPSVSRITSTYLKYAPFWLGIFFANLTKVTIFEYKQEGGFYKEKLKWILQHNWKC